jgi:hypothetical protein
MTLKKRLLELVANDDGKLSRTQIILWIAFALTIGLIVAHAVKGGGVLSWQVMTMLCVLYFFALADRVQAKFASFHLGKDGVGVSLGSDIKNHDI